FFVNWAKNESKIIELTTSLQEIYSAYYQFSNREFSAWQTLIRAA
ncbi:29952_t:CDS:1, partial [Racocetra persica]